MSKTDNFIGIDYGSKLAGTTVMVYAEKGALIIQQSEKKQDADAFIAETVGFVKPSFVCIDAPLSLPSAFFGNGADYFYRACDKACQAMSPMFLGGLTARAMRLKNQLMPYRFYEVYPGYLARKVLSLDEVYNKKKKPSTEAWTTLSEKVQMPLPEGLNNWHQFDAILAWLTARRINMGEALVIGDPEEGQIYI